jgi:hypothetical protein
MVKLYKDGDTMAIVTDAISEDEFLDQLGQAWHTLIENKYFEHDWYFQFSYWLPQVVDICCKYRGYKNNVLQRQLLCAGSVFPDEKILVDLDERREEDGTT